MASEVVVLIKSKGGAEVVRDLGAIGTTAEKGSGPIGKLGSALGSVATIASGFVVGQGLLKLPGMFSSATSAAAELEQSIGGVESIFGDSAQTVLAWGRTAHESAGLSQDAFNKLAVPLGAMLKNTGRDMGDVTAKTLELTQRAADMAATFGGPVDEAVSAIAAMMRGETDPIEKYGVSIKAVDVNLRALADTGKKSEKDLTPLELQNARLALLFDQTASAAGQFGREADTAAGKAERLKAKQENLSAQLGTQLLPLQVKWTQLQVLAVDVLTNKLVPALTVVADWLGRRLGPAFAAAGGYVRDVLLPAARDLAGTVAQALVPAFQAAAGFATDTFIPAVLGVADVIGGVAERIGGFAWDKLQEFAGWAAETLVPAVSAAADAVIGMAASAGEFAWDKIKDFGSWASEQGGPALLSLRDAAAGLSLGDLANAWGVVLEKAKPAIDAIRPFAEQLLPAIKSFIEPLKASFAELGAAFADVGAVFAEHKEVFQTLGKIIGAVLVVAIIALLVQIRILIEVFGTALVIAVKAVATALELIAPVLDASITAFEKVIKFTANTVIPAVLAVATVFLGFVGTVAEVASAIALKGVEFFNAGKELIQKLWDGAVSIVVSVIDWFIGLPGRLKGAMGDIGTTFFNIGKEILEAIGRGLDNAKDALLNKVGDIGSAIGSKLNPKNWIGSPKGIQNWYPYYLEHGLQNMLQVASGPLAGRSASAIAAGLASSQDGLRSWSRTGGTLAQLGQGAATQLGSAPMGAAPIVININATGYIQDVRGLVDEIERELGRSVA